MDRPLHESDASEYVERVTPGASPSTGIGRVVFYLVFAFFLFSRDRRTEDPGADHLHEPGARLPAQRDRSHHRSSSSPPLSPAPSAAGVAKLMGDTPTGKIAATVVPAHRHGDRAVHDPRAAATSRPQIVRDRLRGHACSPSPSASRWPSGSAAATSPSGCSRTPTTPGARAEGPGQAGPARRQGPWRGAGRRGEAQRGRTPPTPAGRRLRSRGGHPQPEAGRRAQAATGTTADRQRRSQMIR